MYLPLILTVASFANQSSKRAPETLSACRPVIPKRNQSGIGLDRGGQREKAERVRGREAQMIASILETNEMNGIRDL